MMFSLRPNACTLRRTLCVRKSSGLDNAIYLPYFQMYVDAVCENVPERAREMCLLGMRIPPYQEQQQIVDKLVELKSTVELGSAEGTAMLLIQRHQDETLESLVQALIMYQTSLDMVRAIVSDTMNTLPI